MGSCRILPSQSPIIIFAFPTWSMFCYYQPIMLFFTLMFLLISSFVLSQWICDAGWNALGWVCMCVLNNIDLDFCSFRVWLKLWRTTMLLQWMIFYINLSMPDDESILANSDNRNSCLTSSAEVFFILFFWWETNPLKANQIQQSKATNSKPDTAKLQTANPATCSPSASEFYALYPFRFRFRAWQEISW